MPKVWVRPARVFSISQSVFLGLVFEREVQFTDKYDSNGAYKSWQWPKAAE